MRQGRIPGNTVQKSDVGKNVARVLWNRMQHAGDIIQKRVGLGEITSGTVTCTLQKPHNRHRRKFHTSNASDVVTFDGADEETLTGVIGQNRRRRSKNRARYHMKIPPDGYLEIRLRTKMRWDSEDFDIVLLRNNFAHPRVDKKLRFKFNFEEKLSARRDSPVAFQRSIEYDMVKGIPRRTCHDCTVHPFRRRL